ncbi:hypothetical protein [Flavobacterium limi]|uniref:Lipoprotein n=1 Tax=Flavobacterium limi TaxID=2045105 RepID=A0ABQ1TNX8_9FLAO|nr:hypothetical protein [Flavobacterium limi]GGE97564.1 hypothetical protein GCM10011518_03670 [Flavobacterium limi]
MIKKLFLFSVIISQLTISCSSDDNSSSGDNVNAEIEKILKQPYSNLTPAEQKLKLEAESNELLVQLEKSKSTGATDALENLERLLDINSIDLFNGKNNNEVEDILKVSGAYGIYTWNSSQNKWVKTASTSELKFVFPAKESQTTNNANLSVKSVSSDIKIEIEDTYDWETGEIVNDSFYLPKSADATLSIDGSQVATIATSTKYSKEQTPEEYSYKLTFNGGYAWEMGGKTASKSTSSNASLSYNDKNIIKFNAGTTADISSLITDSELAEYKGKANGLVQIMENFVVVSETDIENSVIDEDKLDDIPFPFDFGSKNYYTDRTAYNLKYSQAVAANFNKNTKAILASKKDGTKIADVIMRSEESGTYFPYETWVVVANHPKGGYWENDYNSKVVIKEYTEVLYLKFKDNTEVAMSVYFSEGFDNLNTKFLDFFNSFNN